MRQNWPVRTNLRRYTRLSNGFSRKLENHIAPVAPNTSSTISCGYTERCASLEEAESKTAAEQSLRMALRDYFQLFWAPAIASALLLALLWAQDELSRRVPWFLIGWFLLALAAQYLATATTGVWIVGLALQTALAIFLLLKQQISRL